METGLNPVQAGGTSAGWVSGNPAGLAALDNIIYIVFDLGPDWAFYNKVLVSSFMPSGASVDCSVDIFGSQTFPITNAMRLLQVNANTDSTGANTLTNTAPDSGQSIVVIPQGRYIALDYNNNDAVNPMGATTRVRVQAFPMGGLN